MEKLQNRNYKNWFKQNNDSKLGERLQLSSYLWSEYRYRLDLCWDLIFKLTITVVTLGAIPYVNVEVVRGINSWILLSPLLGSAIAIVGIVKLKDELETLEHVRKLYRSLQDEITVPFYGEQSNKFKWFVMGYICFLILVSIANLFLIYLIWLPALE